MKVIVVASQKGGVGKTTLTGHLGVAASREGAVTALVDCDPQGSLSDWWNVREAEDPILASVDVGSLKEYLGKLESAGVELVVIDTPPSVTKTIADVVGVADLVLIPTRPSPHDLRAVGATVDIVEAAGKSMVFVVNGAAPRARITGEAAISLSQYGKVAPVTIFQRTDFAASMVDGRTVMELDPEGRSASEVGVLWGYLKDQLERSKKVVSHG